jgi:predicted adenine nucleotide alpha hydrolase (AANH) superfamily ATPase
MNPRETVLVHACCAHCTAYTIEYWRAQGYDVTAAWYNPNIHPFTEHNLRLEAMKNLSQNMNFPLVIVEGYDFKEYFRRVAGHEDERCAFCFELRLVNTARKASELGIKAFTTSLLISPHQNHEILKATAERVAAENKVEFLYSDLRKRYSDSRHITKPMELYRQQYCGCIYSEYERYTDEIRSTKSEILNKHEL